MSETPSPSSFESASPALLKRASGLPPTSSAERSTYPKMREEFKQDVAEMIRDTTGEIIITSHMMPDDDAACSALAQKRILQRLFPDKKFKVAFSDRKIDAWDDLLTNPDEIIWTKSEKGKTSDGKVRLEDIADHLHKGDALIGLDGATFARFSRFEDEIKNKNVKAAILDHHQEPPSNVTTSYVEPESTSTCELIAKMYGPENLTPDVAELLLIGILSDTRGFSVPADYSETKPIAERLQAITGKTHEQMRQRVRKSEQQDLYKEAFKKHVKKYEIPGKPSQTYSYITIKDMMRTADSVNPDYDLFMARREFGNEMVDNGDTDIYWTTRPGNKKGLGPHTKYNVSFRRSPVSSIDLNELAKMYGGAGHKGAAAGTFELSPTQIEEITKLKTDNPKFNEVEYVCEIIAKDIASKLPDKVVEPAKTSPVIESNKPVEMSNPVPESIETSDQIESVKAIPTALDGTITRGRTEVPPFDKDAEHKSSSKESVFNLIMKKLRAFVRSRLLK